MKSKKSIIGLVVIVAVLVLGIGYAVVSSVGLTINGTATTKAQDLNVSFKSVGTPVNATNGTITGSTTDGSLTASFEVTNIIPGETVSIPYTIQNKESDVDATVVKDSITIVDNADATKDLSEFYDVTLSSESLAVNANSTADLTVSVRMKKAMVENKTAKITINLTANPAQAGN